MRALALTAALVLPLALAACGSDDDAGGVAAADPAPTTATSAPSPTAAPTVGTYPAFEPADYTYLLTVSCFCVGAGAPIAVTVVDGEVAEAVYAAGGGRGAHAGDPAAEPFRLTINDVIAAANDTTADEVTVEWPSGQDYPTSVYVDRDQGGADDEVGYAIADVQVS